MHLLKTADLNLASVLYTLGIPIKGINAVGKELHFYFEDTEKVQQTMNDYYDRKLRVEPNELFWARREIATRMKNEKMSQELQKNRS